MKLVPLFLKKEFVFFLVFCICGFSAISQIDTIFSPFADSANWGQAKTAGDFNNDGFNDLVVLASRIKNKNNKWTGAFSVYYGRGNGFKPKPDLRAEPIHFGHVKGISQCTSGDFNNDGFDDLVVATPFLGEPQLDRGFVQIFWGCSTGLQIQNTLVKKGETAYGSFGSNLSMLDFNGDGIDDLLIESRFAEILEGRIYIYFGNKKFTLAKPDISLRVENSQSLYFTFTDDLNNDGITDIICRSNPNWNANKTQLSFFYGGKKPSSSPEKIFEIDNFAPRLLFKLKNNNSKILLGTYSNHKRQVFTKSIELNGESISDFSFQCKGAPFKISKYWFGVSESSGNIPISFYNVSNNKIELKDTLEFISEDSRLWQPITLFQHHAQTGQKLILPIRENGKEFLVFIDLPKY